MQDTCRTINLRPQITPLAAAIRPCIALHIFLSPVAFAAPSAATEEEGIYWEAQQVFIHDDNLYRLPEGQSPGIPGYGSERGDTISSTQLVIGFDKRYSLQTLHADVELRHNAFRTYDYLDYTATNLHAYWDWALGRYFTGRISASQDENLRGFADFAYTTKSVNTFRRLGASGDYWFHPEWSFGLGLGRVSSDYSDTQSADSEYAERSAEALLTYRPSTGNRISAVLRQTNGEYPNRVPGGPYPSDYRQRDLQARGEWGVAGLSGVNGYLGYTERKYDNFSSRDFSGFTGRLTYRWQASGKLMLNTGLRRELGAQQDLSDNYVVTAAANIGANWSINSLFALGGNFELRQRDYGGDPGLGAAPAVGKDDRTRFLSLYADYFPLSWLSLRLHVQREELSGDQSASDYNDTLSGLTATARF